MKYKQRLQRFKKCHHKKVCCWTAVTLLIKPHRDKESHQIRFFQFPTLCLKPFHDQLHVWLSGVSSPGQKHLALVASGFSWVFEDICHLYKSTHSYTNLLRIGVLLLCVCVCTIIYMPCTWTPVCSSSVLNTAVNTEGGRDKVWVCLFTHLYKVVSHYLGSHEDEHYGKTVCDISCGLHHDDSQTESHPHNATWGERRIITGTMVLS